MIGWFLAKSEKVDPYKVVMMCLFHDTSEARTGDQNWVHKKYVKTFDDEAIPDQVAKIPFGADILQIKTEYEKRESPEAIVAKDADLIDQVILLKEYAWQGNKEAELWLVDSEQGKRLVCDSAKKLVREIVNKKPSDWWGKTGWSAERRK